MLTTRMLFWILLLSLGGFWLSGAQPAPGQDAPTVTRPALPRHYPHIRIAMLAYHGNPMGSFEDQLLRNSVDLVIPNDNAMKHIRQVAPKTPQLIYTNCSNLYLDLLTDWLDFADRNRLAREGAFYHVVKPTPFRGDSPSSRPVAWFWRVFRGTKPLYDVTSEARGNSSGVPFPLQGALSVGYPDRFREINLDLSSGASGWTAALEYHTTSGVWKTLPTREDTTGGLRKAGRITFDPPADWGTTSIQSSPNLFYIRYRVTRGGTAPVARSILGRDYVGAQGKTAGVVPVFDTEADTNQDGYLDDAEYTRRGKDKDARFLYESRMPTESYGQMRFCVNPADAGFRRWVIDYQKRYLKKHPLASGLFMDNSEGRVPAKQDQVREPVAKYVEEYASLLEELGKAIRPHWILANTAGGYQRADPVVRKNPAYFEEFGIRPLSHHYGYFEDLAEIVQRRSKFTTPSPLVVLDSHPQRGDPIDARTQLGALAYYYLLADPEWTFLMFFGGFEPSSPWKRHWCPAVAFDVGKPTGPHFLFASGDDPANPTLQYKVFQREYEKALILFKPLAHARGFRGQAPNGDNTATTHELPASFRPLHADGTLGASVREVRLRSGEGAILAKNK
jgi:hypothetical protein